MKKYLTFLFVLAIHQTIYAQYVSLNAVNCKINDTEQRKIEKLIAYERMFCNEIFETEQNITVPVKINLYGKYKEFRAVKETYKVPSQTNGFFISGLNEAFVYKTEDYISVTAHEASHSIFESNFKKAPKWINEGLAEFFETLDFDSDGNLYAYPQSNRIKRIKAGINEKDRFNDFFKIYGGSFYGHDADDNYNTAYGVIYYFIKTKSTTTLKKIIKLTTQGYDTEKAIALTFGSLSAFEDSYRRFYNFHK